MVFFKRKIEKRRPSPEAGGIILFQDVKDAMRAEKVLKASLFRAKMVAPPKELRLGCDLAVKIMLVEQPGIEYLLKEQKVPFTKITTLSNDTPDLLEMVKVTDFGKWVMIKAGNMKLTFEKGSGIIVNTSGGGCPDIPHLNFELIGKPIHEAPRPSQIGLTLCARMLDRAFEEGLSLVKKKGN